MYFDDLMSDDPPRLRLLLGGLRTRLANTRELSQQDVELVRWLVQRTCGVLEQPLPRDAIRDRSAEASAPAPAPETPESIQARQIAELRAKFAGAAK